MGQHVRAGELEVWTERVGDGPDVLLIGGLGDTVESWQFQLEGIGDRYRLTAFDNRGAGRTAMPSGPLSVEEMADDAAGVLRGAQRSLSACRRLLRRQHHRPGAGVPPPGAASQPRAAEHLAGDGPLPALVVPVRALAGRGRAVRTGLPRGFFLDIYTARAHNDDVEARG